MTPIIQLQKNYERIKLWTYFTSYCNYKTDIIDIHFSDYEEFFFTDDDQVAQRVNYEFRRIFKESNFELSSKQLVDEDWNWFHSTVDVNEAFNNFHVSFLFYFK